MASLLLGVALIAPQVANAQTKITWAFPWLGHPQWGTLAKQLVAEFMESHPETEIELFAGQRMDWLKVQIAAGTQPDLYMWWESSPLLEFGPGILVDLRPQLERMGTYETVMNDISPMFRERFMVDGKLLALPVAIELVYYIYSPSVLERSGVAPPERGWKWADLADIAKKLTLVRGEDVQQWGYMMRDTAYEALMNMKQNGAELFSEDGRTFLPDVEKVEEAWEWTFGLVQLNHMAFPHRFDLFATGRIGIYQTGTWGIAQVRAANRDFALAPPLTGQIAATAANAQLFMAFRSGNPAKERAAAEFIAWVTQPPQAARHAIAWANLPARFSTISEPAFSPVLDMAGSEYLEDYLTAAWDYHWHPVLQKVLGSLERNFNAGLAGQIPMSEAVTNVRLEGQAELERFLHDRSN